MPANTGANKFAGARRAREGGKRGIASGRGGSNPFQVREESRRSETIYFLFLSAILLPHSNNARGGRGIEEKGERSQANWIRMLQVAGAAAVRKLGLAREPIRQVIYCPFATRAPAQVDPSIDEKRGEDFMGRHLFHSDN